MKSSMCFGSGLAVVALALTSVLGAQVASAAPIQPNKNCEDEFQGGCVKWYTGVSTCDHIVETSAPEHRKKACAVWVTTGTMHIER
ncbi:MULTISPECIES: hypothetical protein [unclassified Rathayibacter]|uniref:hypothetical protein n=1 Tax=unclassified Rathayibacter TaxID=2609250 RepID=UPI000CE927B5|nr:MULTISPECIES: hypothetical protein [unclassified Rathayibacter]PPI42174.1 hypothetical protein C5D50_00845 [Rathayibacter sp. RFBD1]PPI63908.1 hypothetical protein C5D38_00845 [Rathayibacter sp. TRS19]